IDKTLIEASAILRNQSLKIADTVYKADIARDVVLDVRFAGQPLKAGRVIPKGSQITLVLGNGQGADDIEVPNLIGLSLSEARFALSGVGLNLGNITYSGMVTDSLSTTVVAQQPDTTSGFISLGSPVNVTLANYSTMAEKRGAFRKVAGIILVVVLVLGAVVAWLGYQAFLAPSVTDKQEYLYVKSSDTFEDVVRTVTGQQLVKDARFFRYVAEAMEYPANV